MGVMFGFLGLYMGVKIGGPYSILQFFEYLQLQSNFLEIE